MQSKSAGDQLKSLLHDAPIGIAVFRGKNSVCEMANAFYLEIVDREEKDFVGKPLFESLPEVRVAVEPLVESVLGGTPYHGHEFPVILNRYGRSEVAYFNFIYQPVHDDQGKINGFMAVATEVTSHVVARQKLSESETKFRDLFAQSNIAMTIILGEDFVVDIANKKMSDNIWRRKAEEVVGKKILDVFPELKDQKFPALLQKVYTEGITHSESEALAFVEGNDGMKRFYLDYSYEPLFDNHQNVFGILITVTDVTERVEVRKRLEEAEGKMKLAIDSADLGTYEIDLTTDDVKVSKRFLDIFGFDEPVSRSILASRIEPSDLEIRANAHKEALRTGHLFYEIRIHPREIQTTWIRAEGTVLRDKNGNATTLIGVIKDITDEKNFAEELERQVQYRTEELQAANEEIAATNEELSETNNQLVTANFELEQFNYAASHDLQEPVRKIQTLASYLLTEGDTASKEKTTDFLKRIYTSADRMKNLIDDLLLYARESSTEKQFVSTNLNTVLEGVRSDLDMVIEQKQAKVDIGPLPTLNAIPGQMHQLFRNLLSNSLKFVREGVTPEIKVRATREKDHAHITFEDNGIGFQQEFADYVFKLFKRLHSKSEYHGTGIGLSLCKKIVQNHGGDIHAESIPGEGTAMHIILPLYSSEEI